MTYIKSYGFNQTGIAALGTDNKESNWPVVYQIYNDDSIYIGETTNLKNRMLQHAANRDRGQLQKFLVVFDESFNKSVALDLEAQLIQWFSGDGVYKMQNKNDGIVDREYFDRVNYQEQFPKIWQQLQELGIAQKSVTEIENSGLFKFSPYKRLNSDQQRVVYEVLTDIEESLTQGTKSVSIVGGSEGTGKTIVIMYLVKLIRDIQDRQDEVEVEQESDQIFDLFFRKPFRARFEDKSIAVVVPNQSLKGSIAKIFKGISNLGNSVDLLSPIDFGSSNKNYDITFVDEAHLLKRSNQEVHKANRQRVDLINKTLFDDDRLHTELDWIVAKSRNVVMVYGDQRVRPNNILKEDIDGQLVREYVLKSQIRSKGGELYINHLKQLLSNDPPAQKQIFEDFEFKLFEDFQDFVLAIKQKNSEAGLSRLVAGFAWDWKSKKDKTAADIEIDGIQLQWNSTLNDWVGSAKSVSEVGSIYTVQGYDLNYCGVIIGDDLQYDPINKRLVFNKQNYFDRGAKKRSKQQLELNIKITDEELLDQVIRTYRILMNRSVKGTYLYVCDRNLRAYLSQFIEV